MKNLRILLMLGSVLIIGCSSQAEKEIVDFQLENNPEKWLKIARQSNKLGDYTQAVKQFEAILLKEPENLLALQGLAKAYTSLHQYQKALNTWDKLLQLDSEQTSAKIAKARLLIRFGDFENAEALLKEASIKQPDNWRIWDGLGVTFDLQGNFTQAATYYNLALEKNAGEAEIYNNLGYSQIMSQAYKQAIETLQKGLKLQPDSKHIRNNLAIAYAWQGNYKDALMVSDSLMSKAESYNNIGYIALMRKDYKTAETYFQEAIDMSPAFYRKAFLNLEKLRTERAENNK